ncbi:MAG: LysM peptidoglycan-binding domain-containing protein [Anaerolineae bacterium]|nr:LysM peptidoglycan-binding domain-containing protein [Anaerolineae bacterium]
MRIQTLFTRTLPFVIVIVLCTALVPMPGLAQDGNLLENPGFEGGYAAWNDVLTAQLAPGWTPWWVPQTEDDLSWRNRQPEWKAAEAPWLNRIRSGEKAQQYFTFYGTHIGGVYQSVSVNPGDQLRFTIWVQVWSSAYDDAAVSEAHGQVDVQVGIDPKGGTNGLSGDIVWSAPKQQYDEWFLMSVETTAAANKVTVFVRSAPEFPVKHNDIYLDDALLVVTGQGEVPTQPPTPTPDTIDNQTPVPTATPRPNIPTMPPTPTPLPAGTIVYIVQAGDSLSAIARRYNTTVDRIAAANNLADPNRISVGQRLLIPDQPLPTAIPPTAAPTATPVSAQPAQPTPTPQPVAAVTHTVQVGDNLYRLALRYGTTVEAIAAANGIVNPNIIRVGQVLKIGGASAQPAPAPAPQPSTGGTHLVQAGENLFRIAMRYNTTVEAIAAANGIANPNLVPAGQVLRIP